MGSDRQAGTGWRLRTLFCLQAGRESETVNLHENEKTKGDSVENHTDVLIFYTAVCAGAPQTALMADGESLSRISCRTVASSASERRYHGKAESFQMSEVREHGREDQ